MWVYGYDHRNQLVLVEKQTSPSGPVELRVAFAYDVFGYRLQKSVDADGDGAAAAQVTRFVVDAWKTGPTTSFVGTENVDVHLELDADGSLTTRYVRGDVIDELFARVDYPASGGPNPYWYLVDHQGSIRDIVDASGTVVDSLTYDGFGNILSETNPALRGNYACTSREWDAEIDLQYNRARYYDPATGRWISQDPLGFDAGDSNLYRYVHNRPTGATDPSGLKGPTAVQPGSGARPGITFPNTNPNNPIRPGIGGGAIRGQYQGPVVSNSDLIEVTGPNGSVIRGSTLGRTISVESRAFRDTTLQDASNVAAIYRDLDETIASFRRRGVPEEAIQWAVRYHTNNNLGDPICIGVGQYCEQWLRDNPGMEIRPALTPVRNPNAPSWSREEVNRLQNIFGQELQRRGIDPRLMDPATRDDYVNDLLVEAQNRRRNGDGPNPQPQPATSGSGAMRGGRRGGGYSSTSRFPTRPGGTGAAYNEATGQGVYVLRNPRTGQIEYVGRGDAPARIREHARPGSGREDLVGEILFDNNLPANQAMSHEP